LPLITAITASGITLPGFLDVVPVTPVKRVVFRDDSDRFHLFRPTFFFA
jgi:hypothetical protein